MTTTPRMVRITWEDACNLDGDASWVPTDEGHKHTYAPVIITTVGFLLHEGDDGLIVTGAWCPDRTGPRDQIPAGMVRLIEYLEPARARRRAK